MSAKNFKNKNELVQNEITRTNTHTQTDNHKIQIRGQTNTKDRQTDKPTQQTNTNKKELSFSGTRLTVVDQ